MGATRLVRPSQHARPMALVSAVATLLAALFFCLGAGPGPENHHAGTGPRTPSGATATGTTATPAATGTVVEYICPYDRGGCSLFPSLSPAVLSAPPLDPPLHAADGLPRFEPPSGDGAARRSGVRPRAPDLHVLQVLRT
ncbi:hypothetical protein ABZY16_24620 [Streptomyces sp. NPDC006553]|uniref:hypothetical protein n=1 Tax=unclassified Streptomyces TaxID=2593676 RepID=UPI00225AA6DD|nr:hypothetical protein [Streptomyces sp. NBC_00233]MCX5225848.1 hypothetical protein [Streptomyces sp. NBC_00233]